MSPERAQSLTMEAFRRGIVTPSAGGCRGREQQALRAMQSGWNAGLQQPRQAA